MGWALGLSLLVVVYNNVINRWDRFHEQAYVPANLAFTTALTLLAAITQELTRAQLGFRGDLTDVVIALVAVAPVALALFAVVRSRYARRIADQRVQGLRGGLLAYHVLVRIPIGTGVTEEVLFRGVLFALWRNAGASTIEASLCASVAFGLWHIVPTIIGITMNYPAADGRKVILGVAGAVVLTTIVGLGLTWLRVVTGGLVAPILIHGGINSIGAFAAVQARRRIGSDEPEPAPLG